MTKIAPGLVRIDIALTTQHYGPSWTYGPCSFAPRVTDVNKELIRYVKKCVLSPGKHTLTCRNTENVGWRGAFVEIHGRKYCNDYVGYTTRQKITTLGIQFNIEILCYN